MKPACGLLVIASAALLVGQEYDSWPVFSQTLEYWYCTLLTRRTVCRRAGGNTPTTQNIQNEMKPAIVETLSWSYKTTVVIKRHQQKHHINKYTNILTLPSYRFSGGVFSQLDGRLP